MPLKESSFRKPKHIVRAIGVMPNPEDAWSFRLGAYAQIGEMPPMHRIDVVVPPPQRDPYADNRAREQAFGGAAVMAQLTYDHPANVRARKVAALRESMSQPVPARFPPEGRSDRVYLENRR